MGYVRDTIANEIRLEGDDFGAASASILLPSAPAGAKKMQFVYRAWFDAWSASPSAIRYTFKGWNHTNYFGLAFNDDTLRFAIPFSSAPFSPAGFFGWVNQEPVQIALPSDHYEYDSVGRQRRTAGDPAKGLNSLTWRGGTSSDRLLLGFMDGNGGHVFATNGFDSFADDDAAVCLPNVTDGLDFTGYWEIWASNIDKTMYGKAGVNFDTLVGDDMFDAIAAPWSSSEREFTIHADVVSTLRPSFDVVNFFSHFKMRYTLPDFKLVFKEARVRYLDWNDTEL